MDGGKPYPVAGKVPMLKSTHYLQAINLTDSRYPVVTSGDVRLARRT